MNPTRARPAATKNAHPAYKAFRGRRSLADARQADPPAQLQEPGELRGEGLVGGIEGCQKALDPVLGRDVAQHPDEAGEKEEDEADREPAATPHVSHGEAEHQAGDDRDDDEGGGQACIQPGHGPVGVEDRLLAARGEAPPLPDHAQYRVGEEEGDGSDVDEEGVAVEGGLLQQGRERRREEEREGDHPRHEGQAPDQHVLRFHRRMDEHTLGERASVVAAIIRPLCP
jgi:hypothetical protein